MSTVKRNQLKINALEMLRRPGTMKIVQFPVDPAVIELSDERLVPDSTIDVDLVCESLSDGIVVRGHVTGMFLGECRRCLQLLVGRVETDVHELYQVTITDPDAFLIENDQVDLAPMIRETMILELPDGPLCKADCAGLCATCGKDLNEGHCSCPSGSVDPRWSVLDALRDELPD
jgi:uncharacterized protein